MTNETESAPASDSVRRVRVVVSGGMTVERVREIAALGRLLISVGAITHSAPALDIALEIEPA